jgi:hypothetical protein
MIIFLISFLTTLSLLSCFMYYNSVKDIYVNHDINEFLLSSVVDDNYEDADENDNY